MIPTAVVYLLTTPFAVTAAAYRYLLDEAGIKDDIKHTLKDLNTKDLKNLQQRGKKVREIILNAEFPDDLKEQIYNAYEKLEQKYISRKYWWP